MSRNTVDERGEEADAQATPRTGALVAQVEEYDDAPDECTIYPPEAPADQLVTRWITAEEGSFVDLADAR